jgi:hypothetical protein
MIMRKEVQQKSWTIMQKKKLLFSPLTWCALRWKTYDSCDSWLPEITWDEWGRKTQKLYLYLILNFSEIPYFNSFQRPIKIWDNGVFQMINYYNWQHSISISKISKCLMQNGSVKIFPKQRKSLGSGTNLKWFQSLNKFYSNYHTIFSSSIKLASMYICVFCLEWTIIY